MSVEASSSTSAIAIEDEVPEWLHSVLDIDDPRPNDTPHDNRKEYKIQRVANTSDEEDSKYYEPLVVSIGPIHHGKPRLEAMEESKRSVARSYMHVYASVEGDLLRARNFYPEPYSSAYTSEQGRRDWCLMMFLDACFVVKFVCSNGRTVLNLKKHVADLVRRDLLLLENQLPFELLRNLAYFGANPGFETRAKIFFCECIGIIPWEGLGGDSGSAAHLLDYLRTLWIGPELQDMNCGEFATGFHLTPQFLLSVTELKKAGIQCSLAKVSTSCITQIKFKSHLLSGELILPRLQISEWTKPLLLNLVAYELSQDDLGVSHLLYFMGQLINRAEDVKELRQKGILVVDNFMGNDQAVADLFNETTKHVVPDDQAFARVRSEISTYFTSKRQPLRVVLAEFKQRYFGTPWSFLVFLAVIFTVAMTIIQTVLAGIQTYLAAKSTK